MTYRDAPVRRRSNGRLMIAALIGAVALGGATALWAGNRLGWIDFRREAKIDGAAMLPPSPTPTAEPSAAGLESAQTALNVRLAELEQRMTKLNLQADAASGNAARAEALLIAAAARRTIERGEPLGYLANELKTRFGDSQPNAVQTLVEVSANPVTLDALGEGLAGLRTVLLSPPRRAGLAARVQSELSSLFVFREASAPSPAPERRLERARLFLDTGRVDAAIGEVQRMPGRDMASDWVTLAQRYVRAQRALDLIETAAIIEPNAVAEPAGEAGGRRVPGTTIAG